MMNYHHIKLIFGYFISTLKLSLGDFGIIDSAPYLNQNETVWFWITFILMLVITNIIFLNFVIAEATNSYNNVKENIEEYV